MNNKIYHKHLLTGLFFVLLSSTTFSQLAIVQTFPPVETKYSDAWSATAFNPLGTVSCYADIKITKDGKMYLQAKTRQFTLTGGDNTISFSRLQIENITVQPNGGISWNRYFTQGLYEICLHIKSIESPLEGESCSPLEVLPLSPPMLASPANGETVNGLPLLTWLPPIPMNIYDNLQYDLKLVEVMPMQSPYEAVARNMPLAAITNQTGLTYQYSPSNAPLKNGSSYAWQITATDRGKMVGKTEVWKFTLSKDTSKVRKELMPDFYYQLGDANSKQSYGTARGCIGFTSEKEFLKNFTFTLSDKQGKALDTSQVKLVPAKQSNYYILYLNESSQIKEGGFYRLNIDMAGNKHYFLDFLYKRPELK